MSEKAEREALCRYSVLLEGDEPSDEAEKFDLILVRYSIFLYSTNAEDSWLMLAAVEKLAQAHTPGSLKKLLKASGARNGPKKLPELGSAVQHPLLGAVAGTARADGVPLPLGGDFRDSCQSPLLRCGGAT